MRRQPWLGVSCAILGLALVSCHKASDDIGEQFMVVLQGANEVPPRATPATGNMGFNVSGNRVDYSIEVYNLTTPIIGAHIHCCGAQATAGVNGPIRIALFPGPGANSTSNPLGGVNGQLYEGSFEASDVVGVTYAELLANMRAGTAYGNVHTTQFPGGEIRGQVQVITR